MRILIIDDSRVMRAIIQRSLIQIGLDAEFFEARNGKAGLDQLSNRPDIVFCDWNMPIMNGLEFVIEARRLDLHTPIVMVTTEAGSAKHNQAKNAGANAVLTKPFTPEDLAIEVANLVPS